MVWVRAHSLNPAKRPAIRRTTQPRTGGVGRELRGLEHDAVAGRQRVEDGDGRQLCGLVGVDDLLEARGWIYLFFSWHVLGCVCVLLTPAVKPAVNK